MILDKALKSISAEDLKEIYGFWDKDTTPPERIDKIVPLLKDFLSNDDMVRKRLNLLSKKLLDVLKFFMRSENFSSNIQHILNSNTFSYMSQYEMEAAINALQKRGFLFEETTGNGARTVGKELMIPAELGDILQTFLWDEDKEIYDTFAMGAFLNKLTPDQIHKKYDDLFLNQAPDSNDLQVLIDALSKPEEIFYRISLLEDEGLKKFITRSIIEFGGVTPFSTYEKVQKDLPDWNHRVWKEELESKLLGTVRHLSLGEYGINHFDDTIVLFHEVVDAYMGAPERVNAQNFSEIQTLGVDLISDISSFLSFVNHNKTRLTLSGAIYRTAIKKVIDTFILSKKEEFDEEEIFQCIYSFCLTNRMIQRKGDRNLSLTIKGKVWDHQPLEKKLVSLISFAFEEWEPGEDQFHAPHLKKMFVEYLKSVEINRWYDVMYLPFKCRNCYLANLDNNNIRDMFQNRYQYTQSTNMRDTMQLGHSLFQWLRNRFYLLGLVDLAFEDGKVAAVRLNPLGAKGLGKDMDSDEDYKQNPLIVNPDFEVILFQEGDSYSLIMQLDKFAVRIKSDSTYHFKITSTSVEKAVAGGMTAAEIITILSENSRVVVPQNVIYSIKEWGEKVKFVQVSNVTLLRGRSKEVVDRILQSSRMKEFVLERLSPTAVLVNPDYSPKKLGARLEKLGVFLEKEGEGDAPDHDQ